MSTPPKPVSRLVPWVVSCALFMENLDSTILTTAIPAIAADFDVSPLQLKLGLTSYLISLAVFIPASGWVAQAYGFRRVFCSALVGFTVGSWLCGLSQTLGQLVLARMLQGMGGAMMVPVARFLLMRSFPTTQLVRITNLVTVPALVGPAIGPVLGGALTQYGHWRLIFLINLPVGLLGLWAARRALPKDTGQRMPAFDFVGFALCGLGMCGLSFSLEFLGEPFLAPSSQVLLAITSLALLTAYVWHGRGHPAPFLQLKLFAVPSFRIGIAASIASRLGVGGMPFLLPLFYQTCLGESAMLAGAMVMPMTVGMLGMKFFVTRLLRMFGFRCLLMGNTALLAISMLQFVFIEASTPVGLKLAAAFVYGALGSVQFSCMNVLAYVDIERPAMGQATSIFSTVQQFSMGAGVGLSAFILAQLWHGQGWPMQAAYHMTFAVMAGLTLASVAVFARLARDTGVNASGHGR